MIVAGAEFDESEPVGGAESLTVLYTEKGYGEAWFATAKKQANGVSCTDEGVTICAVNTGNGVWTAIDRIDAMTTEQLADFLREITDAR